MLSSIICGGQNITYAWDYFSDSLKNVISMRPFKELNDAV